MAVRRGPDRGPPLPECQTGDQGAPGLSGPETLGGLVWAGQRSHQDLSESGQDGQAGQGSQSSQQDQAALLPELHWGDPAEAQQSDAGGSAGQMEDCVFIKSDEYNKYK